MQEAVCGAREVHIYGHVAERCTFLPFVHGLQTYSQWLAVQRNHGRGRMLPFVAALLLALPLLLTLHTLEAEPPMTERSHQLTRYTRHNAALFYT